MWVERMAPTWTFNKCQASVLVGSIFGSIGKGIFGKAKGCDATDKGILSQVPPFPLSRWLALLLHIARLFMKLDVLGTQRKGNGLLQIWHHHVLQFDPAGVAGRLFVAYGYRRSTPLGSWGWCFAFGYRRSTPLGSWGGILRVHRTRILNFHLSTIHYSLPLHLEKNG